ncbi:hypothetical protein RSO01_74130 [Reyranella soli]|uniref:Uncharacterized protein n=1 Tax=Reyranella soli TaxID=1230389 RepID=A0A512NMR2_9HYPH|nr:hypothetical protein RSO01_74130 [Reyranella soli]
MFTTRRYRIQRRDKGESLKQLLGHRQGNDADRQFLVWAGQKRETNPASGVHFAADRKLTTRRVKASRFPGRRLTFGHNDLVGNGMESGGYVDAVEGAQFDA